MSKNIMVGIPMYNEEKNLEKVILDVFIQTPSKIVIINDGSTDESEQLVKEMQYNLFTVDMKGFDQNRGYGAAFQEILNYAKWKQTDYLIVLDSDSQHDPSYMINFLGALDKFPVIHGTRYHEQSPVISSTPKINKFAREATKMVLDLVGINSSDPLCGYWGFNMNEVNNIALTKKGYSAPIEFWHQLKKQNQNVVEIPVSKIFYERDYALENNTEKIELLAKDFLQTALDVFQLYPDKKELAQQFYDNLTRIIQRGRYEFSSDQINIFNKILSEKYERA